MGLQGLDPVALTLAPIGNELATEAHGNGRDGAIAITQEPAREHRATLRPGIGLHEHAGAGGEDESGGGGHK